jgi:hypothetical protein
MNHVAFMDIVHPLSLSLSLSYHPGYHPVGYFSKEKYSDVGYNLVRNLMSGCP